MIGYLDKDIRPLVWIITKMSRYVKASKVEDKNNNFMSFRIDDGTLFGLGFKTFKWNSLPVYDDGHIKTIPRTYGKKVLY